MCERGRYLRGDCFRYIGQTMSADAHNTITRYFDLEGRYGRVRPAWAHCYVWAHRGYAMEYRMDLGDFGVEEDYRWWARQAWYLERRRGRSSARYHRFPWWLSNMLEIRRIVSREIEQDMSETRYSTSEDVSERSGSASLWTSDGGVAVAEPWTETIVAPALNADAGTDGAGLAESSTMAMLCQDGRCGTGSGPMVNDFLMPEKFEPAETAAAVYADTYDEDSCTDPVTMERSHGVRKQNKIPRVERYVNAAGGMLAATESIADSDDGSEVVTYGGPRSL